MTTSSSAAPRPVRWATDAAGLVAGSGLAALGAVRRGKPLHPRGVTYAGRLVVTGTDLAPAASTLLSVAGERRAVVRVSRSIGLPDRLPDLLGLSIRVPDAYGPGEHQDILLVSSVDRPVLHHLFVPARDPLARAYTSSLPYRAGDETFLLGALPDPRATREGTADEDPVERLTRSVAGGSTGAFLLAVAPVGGRFRPVARLCLDAVAPPSLDALRFSPFNSGGGLEPAGVVNDVRRRAYPVAQRGWDGTAAADAARRAESEQRGVGAAAA